MTDNVFNIANFNVLSDNDNYYFFRALNNGDNNDIENNITTNMDGSISTIRTDRSRYEGISKYKEDSTLSLEEVVDHIKMHHRTDTNCISLSSNANVSLLYGREYYQDKYVIVKVPKNELGKTVINASEYMINEINSRINNLLNNNELSEEIINYLNKIDNIQTKEELDKLTSLFSNEEDLLIDSMFEKGIEYNFKNVTTVDYQALTKEQNLEKDKIVAKLNIIGRDILPRLSNKFLIQTLGNACSSLEFIHYNDILQDELISIPKELVDIFAMLQQLPTNYPMLNELKGDLLKLVSEGKFKVEEFNYHNLMLNIEDDYTIEKMYTLTNGNVDYYSAINLYKKSFYLSKSKLRTLFMINNLNNMLNKEKYQNIFEALRNNTYGVEPKIFSKMNSNKLKVSESVNLDFGKKELELFYFVNNLDNSDLNYIINKPIEALKFYLTKFNSIERKNLSREEYYANAIIDIFDWEKLGVVKFNAKRRNDLVNKLISNNIVALYEKLKAMNIKEEQITNTLLTIVIKDLDLSKIDLDETFTAEDLDDFMGYYRIKGTPKLKLRSYQASSLRNIDKCLKNHQFTAAILPTGAGKSFVALAEMLEYKDKEILYLAPNDVILNQIEDYIIEYITGDTNKKNKKEIIKEVFPKLKLATYQSLGSYKEQVIDYHGTINNKWDLIIFDELHRSGAPEWKKHVLELLNNQDNQTKVLGITATPERDVDLAHMGDEWAEYFSYTEEEIDAHKHLAVDMDVEDAIRLGYVINPKIASCEYSLLNDEGILENLNTKLATIEDEDKQKELISKLDYFRKRFAEADGISKVIGDNIKLGGRYIVFCPIVNNQGEVIEDEDGLLNNSRITGEDVINKYINELKGYLKEYYQLSDEEIDSMLEFHSMLGKYGPTKNQQELKNFENKNPNKIKFMVVMNKLNEGSHAKNDGLIWFRPLDENSKILFLQQLGRIIYSINPNKEVLDEDRPIAIDIPCNCVRVKLNKRIKQSDLEKLKLIEGWINSRDGKIPDINSYDRVESSYASSLKKIQTKYIDYLDNEELLSTLNKKKKIQTLEILKIGNSIGIWNYQFPDKIKVKRNNNYNENPNDDIFSINSILKDFYEFEEEVNNLCKGLSYEEKIAEYIEFMNIGYIPKANDPKKQFSDGSFVNQFWRSNNYKNRDRIKLELETNLKYQVGYETAKKILKESIEESIKHQENKIISTLSLEEKLVEYIEFMNIGYIPKEKDPNKQFSDGSFVNQFWHNHKLKIKLELEINPRYEVGYEVAKRILKETLEDKISLKLAEYIEFMNKGYIPRAKDQNKQFSDGSQVNTFFSQAKYKNRDRIKLELETNPKYQVGYETAKRILQESYEKSRKSENKSLVKELCISYGIDININKKLLNKSYNEVYAKICYLTEFNIPLTKDGVVHEIFFMSDINMQAKYNISLDSLIKQYINESNRGLN